MKRIKQDVFITLWIIFGIIIILGFLVFSMIIGGSAGLGYCENRQFFVCSHADITQVSELAWHISYVWGILFWVFIPLTPLGAFFIAHIQEKIERRKNRLE